MILFATPVLKEVYDSDWGTVLLDDIEVLGESIENMKVKNFKLCEMAGNSFFKSKGKKVFNSTL